MNLDQASHMMSSVVAVSGGNGSPPGGDLGSKIGEHIYYCLGKGICSLGGGGALGIGSQLNLDTIGMTVVVMAIIIGLALLVRARLSVDRPRGVQNVLEASFDFVNGFVEDSLGRTGVRSIGPLAVALFLFILLSNWIGLLPLSFINGFHSPTSDINTTVGFALMVFVLVQFSSIRARGGGGYVKHFFQPAFLTPINFIEEIVKPVSLAFRLFGNIFAGEVLFLVLSSLLTGFLVVGLVVGNFVALALGLFVGAVQAFIFTILTVAYIGIATSTEGH